MSLSPHEFGQIIYNKFRSLSCILDRRQPSQRVPLSQSSAFGGSGCPSSYCSGPDVAGAVGSAPTPGGGPGSGWVHHVQLRLDSSRRGGPSNLLPVASAGAGSGAEPRRAAWLVLGDRRRGTHGRHGLLPVLTRAADTPGRPEHRQNHTAHASRRRHLHLLAGKVTEVSRREACYWPVLNGTRVSSPLLFVKLITLS